MQVISLALPDVKLVQLKVHGDLRGFFIETYREADWRPILGKRSFVQDNQSLSTRGTLRGLHAQLRKPQGKLVQALQGEIFDVAVDIRPRSPTFGKWTGARLKAEDFRQMFIPPGFAHGFCVLSDFAEVAYKCTDFYDPADEIGLRWNDPAVGIAWPIQDPLLSKKDAALANLAELRRRLRD